MHCLLHIIFNLVVNIYVLSAIEFHPDFVFIWKDDMFLYNMFY